MLKFVELDSATTFSRQMSSPEEGPIVLINRFEVPPKDEAVFLALWKNDADFMMAHGCISGQLHRGTEGSCSFVNVAVWESAGHLARAFRDARFQEMLSHYPENCTVSPHIFKKVAVPGICVA